MLCDQLLVGLWKLYFECLLLFVDDVYLRFIVGVIFGFGYGEFDYYFDFCDIYLMVSRCLDDMVEYFGLVIVKEELYGSILKYVG